MQVDQAYNIFLDRAAEFMDAYREDAVPNDDPFVTVAQRIVDRLTQCLALPIDDPQHPIERYGQIDDDEGEYANINRLGQDIMAEIQEPRLRRIVVSFFHSNGAGRDDVEELLEHYWQYSAACHGLVVEEDDEDQNNEN